MPVLWPALPRISPGVQRLPLSGWLRPLPAIRSDTSPAAGLSRGILQADVRCDLLEAFDGRGDELIRTRLARRSNHARGPAGGAPNVSGVLVGGTGAFDPGGRVPRIARAPAAAS